MTPHTSNQAAPGIAPEALRARISEAYARQSREASEERWILDNLPLVRHIAQKIAANLRGRVELDDLISAGTVGLVRAARAFDPTRDAEFRTYAYIRVRGAILDELRGRSFMPMSVHKQLQHVRHVYQRLLSEQGKPPADEDLAREAGVSADDLYHTLQEARKQNFLSIHGLGDEDSTGGSLMPADAGPGPAAQVERKELLARMARAIAEMPKKDRTVLLLYYERDLTMKEIAAVLEVTESRVSQLHASAIFKLSMTLGGTQ